METANSPIYTSETESLCKSISSVSNGVCVLGFSRGKDSIAAWLYLKNFFHTIIPFHCASVPHLSFVDESLDYYEEVFETKIERFIASEIEDSLSRSTYQPPKTEAETESIFSTTFEKKDMVSFLRKKHSCPRAWCAYGINASDSLDRRVYVTQYKGRNNKNKTFYPCWNWTGQMILNQIKSHNIKLPKDYLLSNRSLAGVPDFRNMLRMEAVFPDDFIKITDCYPFIRSLLLRNEYRIKHYQKPSKVRASLSSEQACRE